MIHDASAANCPRCNEVTYNLCAICGFLKSKTLHHCGQLPEVKARVMMGQIPAWWMFHVACTLSFVGGVITAVFW